MEKGRGETEEAIGWRDGQETIRTRAATSSLLDTTAYRQPLRATLRVHPSTSHPPGSSLRASSEPTVLALICIRPIMSSDSPSHPRRHTSRPSIKPRLFLLQLTPTSPPGLDAFVLRGEGVARWSLPPTRTSLMRAHQLCVAQQQSRISLTSGSPSTDDIVPT